MADIEDPVAYLTRLQKFLYDGPLVTVQPNPEMRALYVTNEHLNNYWAPAFTHETYDTDPSRNYEKLEYLGDNMLKAVFADYLMQRLPTLAQLEYTELNTHYMSGFIHKDFAKKLGFDRFLRTSGMEQEIAVGVIADLFESFIGALTRVSNSIVPGLGYINSFNFVVNLFTPVEFDLKRAKGAYQTQVDQIFNRFGLGIPKLLDDLKNGIWTFSVSLTPQQHRFLRDNSFHVPPGEIGRGTAPEKRQAKTAAYQDAFNRLEAVGATTAWAETKKRMDDFKSPIVQPYIQAAQTKLGQEGYISMYFNAPTKTSTESSYILMLIGVKENGERRTLSTVFVEKSEDQRKNSENANLARANLLKNYAAK